MKPEDEKMFFGHDLATPLTNIAGAHYLLDAALPKEAAGAREALDILAANTRTLERMLGWYWRLRELEAQQEPLDPWPADTLVGRLQERIEVEGLPVPAPANTVCLGKLALPQEALEAGLLGAALTLQAASAQLVSWTFEAFEGVLFSRWTVEGDEELLDPSRLFRKLYWPSRYTFRAWVDPCLPYLRAVIEPTGGSLELTWAEGRWTLEASMTLVP